MDNKKLLFFLICSCTYKVPATRAGQLVRQGTELENGCGLPAEPNRKDKRYTNDLTASADMTVRQAAVQPSP